MSSRNYFSLDENHTRVFPEVDAPDKFESVLTVGLVISILCTLFHAAFILRVGHHAWFGKNNAPRRIKKRQILMSNLLCSFMCEIMLVIGLVMKLQWETCSFFGRLPAVFYVTANFASYLVLLERLKSVQLCVKQTRAEILLAKVVKLGTMSVPLISLSCLLIFEGQLFFKEAYCIQVLNSVISWTFTVLDTMLSSGYLLLFLSPVFKHVQVLRGLGGDQGVGTAAFDKDRQNLVNVAKKNLRYSLVTIFSTFLHMVFTSTAAMIIEVGNSPETSTWILSEYISGPLDLAINTSVNLILMKSCWTTMSNGKVKPAPTQGSSK